MKMSRCKYFYNPDTLTFQKEERSLKEKFTRFLILSGICIFMAGIIFFTYHYFFISPKENKLIKENSILSEKYNNLNSSINELNAGLQHLQKIDDNIYRSILETEPIPPSIREAGFGGANQYSGLEGFNSSPLVIDATRQLDKVKNKAFVQSLSFDTVINLMQSRESYIAHKPAIKPLAVRDSAYVISYFQSARRHPILKTVRPHLGIDFGGCQKGTHIYATADGVVITAKMTFQGFGKLIVIDHGFGYKTYYGHCNKILVHEGQKVSRGELIGHLGSTGLSEGPHLHYEVRFNNISVNPIYYYYDDLTAEEYDLMVNNSSGKK